MIGRIIKNISNDYTVLVGEETYICKPRGKFRNDKVVPYVGDIVKIDAKNNYLLEILPRKNILVRPPVCNVDQLIVIASTKLPNFDSNLLDKLLAITEFNDIEPVICLTKIDLLNEKEKTEISEIMKYYQKIGYLVLYNHELDKIKTLFKDKITIFTGQSGAGKSTLLNNIDKELKIKTAEISISLGRGKHTTRHTELIKLNDGWVADTPGFSSLDFTDMSRSDIRDSFIEFNKYKDKCKYKDCMHDLEDDCHIKKLVEEKEILQSRYNNYLKFINKR